MKERKLQVFVSSTYEDLKEERQAAVEAILSAGHIPAGMELFKAGDETQMTVIKRWIDESDVYLLILGGRYGSVDNKTGKSYTQLEYEYAVEQNKPFFAIVITDEALEKKVKDNGLRMTEQKDTKALLAFRELVLSKHIKFWNDTKDIKLAIYETLGELNYREDLIGWVRSNKNVNAALVADEIARLAKENSELQKKVKDNVNTQLYAGLTFEKMIEALNKNHYNIAGLEKSMMDVLYEIGDNLSSGLYLGSYNQYQQAIKDLLILGIVEKKESGTVTYHHLTHDGKLFYIKAVALPRLNISTELMDN